MKDQRIKSNLKLLFLLAEPFQRMLDRWIERTSQQSVFRLSINKEESPNREFMCSDSDLGTHPEDMSSLIPCVIFKELSKLGCRPKIWHKNKY